MSITTYYKATGANGRDFKYAARALVVRDLLPPQHFDALYEPWASVIEHVP